MEVGDVSQSVTVNGDVTPPIDTETGQISSTLDSKAIQNLPSLGRDPFQLLRLAPGVFGDAAHSNNGGSQNTPGSAGPGGTSASSSIFQTENQVQINANGQRNTTNDYQIDGVEVNSLAWGGAAVITPNEESVKEVRVSANSYSAESGRNSGAQVEVVSQNGTNEYHGSLFFKMDRPGLNAFQRYNGPGGPDADQRVANRFNQFGGSVGGPIIKNHLFVFFSYETLRNNAENTNNTWAETPQFLAEGATGSIANNLLSFPGEGTAISHIIPMTCAQAGLPNPGSCAAVATERLVGPRHRLARRGRSRHARSDLRRRRNSVRRRRRPRRNSRHRVRSNHQSHNQHLDAIQRPRRLASHQQRSHRVQHVLRSERRAIFQRQRPRRQPLELRPPQRKRRRSLGSHFHARRCSTKRASTSRAGISTSSPPIRRNPSACPPTTSISSATSPPTRSASARPVPASSIRRPTTSATRSLKSGAIIR